ncbi:MAG: hypothetical protein LBC61_06475 [Candidatus Peribacteria bacterium]|nr:hypothetical protein [Candidatus Peribacteria bacterium]
MNISYLFLIASLSHISQLFIIVTKQEFCSKYSFIFGQIILSSSTKRIFIFLKN